jgi:hypothetical protein
MVQLAEAELARQRTQTSVHEDADPRAGWVARLADAWKEPTPEGGVVIQVGDDGEAPDLREQWLRNLQTAWKNDKEAA